MKEKALFARLAKLRSRYAESVARYRAELKLIRLDNWRTLNDFVPRGNEELQYFLPAPLKSDLSANLQRKLDRMEWTISDIVLEIVRTRRGLERGFGLPFYFSNEKPLYALPLGERHSQFYNV